MLKTQMNAARIRQANRSTHCNGSGQYVLYWMQLFHQLDHNHALTYAARRATKLARRG